MFGGQFGDNASPGILALIVIFFFIFLPKIVNGNNGGKQGKEGEYRG